MKAGDKNAADSCLFEMIRFLEHRLAQVSLEILRLQKRRAPCRVRRLDLNDANQNRK